MENPAAKPVRHPAWRIWDNPIFRRYCRSRLRPVGLGVALLITVLVCGFTVAMVNSVGVRTGMDGQDMLRPAIIILFVIQALILFVLGTAQVAGGMTAERDEGVIDYQRLIPMTPLAKVSGYLFGLPVREYVIFLATLPFTAWCLMRSGVEACHWLPLYATLLSSALLYHFTGLVTGTVVKNRRWAFLVSIGVVFSLYTAIPQMAKFGLVFFKYLTITPVFQEVISGLLPRDAGSVVRTGQELIPTARFFNLDLPEAVFTFFSQGGLIITFIFMLRRKWNRAESHLMGKTWAAGFFVWVQTLLLGNALPLIEPGSLFPSLGFRRMIRMPIGWTPEPMEAVLLCGVYGFVTLGLIFLLAGMITPTRDQQLRGWRRARKQGRHSLPWGSDASSSFGFTLFMALAGAGGWFLFTRALVESRWFPGHVVPLSTLAWFAAVLLACGLVFQTLLETKGPRVTGLAAIFVGVVPIMAGAVIGTISDRLIPVSVWLTAISPLGTPFQAAGSLLPMAELPVEYARALPRAFRFWLLVMTLLAAHLTIRLFTVRRAMKQAVLAEQND